VSSGLFRLKLGVDDLGQLFLATAELLTGA
jgi:hypothetical protein